MLSSSGMGYKILHHCTGSLLYRADRESAFTGLVLPLSARGGFPSKLWWGLGVTKKEGRVRRGRGTAETGGFSHLQ